MRFFYLYLFYQKIIQKENETQHPIENLRDFN